MTIVAISAHRRHSVEDAKIARSVIKTLVENPRVEGLVFGGAIGLDDVALRAALMFRAGGKPKITVVVPKSIDDQPFSTRDGIRLADEVIELGNPITADDGWAAFRTRNGKMIEIADSLVALWNGDLKTGTGHAINLAKRTGKKVIIIQVSGRVDGVP